MSAYAYIGLQGSGKTLKAVNKLYDNFINPKTKDKSEYDCALTNINEFDFDKSDKINKLDFDILYEQLVVLFNLSVLDKETDTVLNEKAKEFNLFNCLIIIDEAPHYLTKDKDTVLLWWIEYHRHMHQDIILITPNKARFRTEYRNSIHYFVKSLSGKYRLRKSVYKYSVFSNYNMNKDDFEHIESFKVKKELFSLYISGKSINQTPIIYKFIAAFIFIISVFIYSTYDFLNQFNNNNIDEDIKNTPVPIQKSSNPITETITDKSSNIIENKKNEYSIDEDEKLFKFKCNKRLCFITLGDQLYEFPIQFISNKISSIDSNKLTIFQNKQFSTFYLLTDKNYFNFIIRKNQTKGVKDGDKKEDNSLFAIGK